MKTVFLCAMFYDFLLMEFCSWSIITTHNIHYGPWYITDHNVTISTYIVHTSHQTHFSLSAKNAVFSAAIGHWNVHLIYLHLKSNPLWHLSWKFKYFKVCVELLKWVSQRRKEMHALLRKEFNKIGNSSIYSSYIFNLILTFNSV